jgi:SHS2 domain-containing protein
MANLKNEHETFYRLFDHTADLGVEIYGPDPAALFINAGYALFEMLVQREEQSPQGRHHRRIEVQGGDWADLMVNWLRELLYLFNGDQQVLSDIRMQALSENELQAVVASEDFMPRRHRVRQEIKAVTYHQIDVGPQSGRWMARVIFDI